jgi:hypothetical protein
MRKMLWMAVLAAGCTAGDPGDPPTSVDTDVDTGDTDSPGPVGDRAVVDAMQSGTTAPSDGLRAVAWSGGWPITDADAGELIFVADPSDPAFEGLNTSSLAVAGDFNDWTPAPMACATVCVLTVSADLGALAGTGYKLVDANETYVADPWARSYTYDEFGQLSYVRPPTDTWRLDRWPDAEGSGVIPRDLRVYVPSGVDSASPARVLYAHDGNNLFDPGAIGGGWRLQDALAGLGEPVLVVGIDNTTARFDDYTHVPDDIGSGPVGGQGDAYADFVHLTVRPHIESIYGSNGVDGQMGSSLGGLISLHIAHRYAGQYDFVASLSGTIGWGRFGDVADPSDMIEARWLAADPGGVVFLSSGGDAGGDGLCTDPDGDGTAEDDPDATDNYCETRQMADALAAAGRTWDADLFHWHAPGAPHNEAAWADIVDLPLTRFEAIAP